MTEDQKQALIAFCKIVVSDIESVEDAHEDAVVMDTLRVFEIALTALTAPPVKLLDCDFGAVSHMSGGSKDYCNGFVDGTQNAIKAIRAAGYQVEGE